MEVRAWAPTPDHVHLILAPGDPDGLRRRLAAVHRRYAGAIHARERKTGRFRRGRFGCVVMDEAHLGAALRHVAMNPVRARLVERAADWRWSSLHACLDPQTGGGVTCTGSALSLYPDFGEPVAAGEDEALSARLRRAESIGRPVGDEAFLSGVERQAGRQLTPRKRSREPKTELNALSPQFIHAVAVESWVWAWERWLWRLG